MSNYKSDSLEVCLKQYISNKTMTTTGTTNNNQPIIWCKILTSCIASSFIVSTKNSQNVTLKMKG